MFLTPKNENNIMSLVGCLANQTSQSGPLGVKLGYLPYSCDIQNLKILRQFGCSILNGLKPLDAEDVRGQLTFESGPPRPEIENQVPNCLRRFHKNFQACILKESRDIKSVMLNSENSNVVNYVKENCVGCIALLVSQNI